MLWKELERIDPEIASAAKKELARQRDGLELIPSENFTYRAVLEAASTVFTNKYAEGYPGKRYYGGCEFVDVVESLAIERAKKLFGAEHVNVQPNSGSHANMEAYMALTDWLKKGDKILGMNIFHGGHLTHGHSVSFSGKLMKASSYGVSKDDFHLDYDEIRKIAEREKPTIIVSGASAYPWEIDFKAFREIADAVGAFHVADIAHIAGLVATKNHKDSVPYTDITTTTTHKTLRGPRGAIILSKKEHSEAVDKAVFPGCQGGPLEHIIAAKAVCFKIAMTGEFSQYQRQIVKNAKALASSLIENGIEPVGGGTENHLMLIDVTKIGLTGSQAEKLLGEVNITVNKNVIPYDQRKPFDPSGIRIGTPAITARGMGESEMKHIGSLISRLLKDPANTQAKIHVKNEVLEVSREFPLYEGI
ncbi:MAG: serine hydroxymethyltransferase [Candidatus Aenigmarchaeota archaeon]|nr:serine hydroxymethyltransferase [Candidatus Aenigmarchaeota archaeon]